MGPGLRELINQLQNWYKTVNQDPMLFLDVFQIINFFLTTLAIKSVRNMYQRNWFLLIAIVQLHWNYRIYLEYSDKSARTNSVDLDQTPRNAASDLGLHCLPLTQQFVVCRYSNIV